MQLGGQSRERFTKWMAAILWTLGMAASGVFYVMHSQHAAEENKAQLQ